jgi:hypothetical protein
MALVGSQIKGNRYIFYQSLGSLYRYDTYTDGWTQLATSLQTPVTFLAIDYAAHCGYYGRVIAAGITSSKTQIAALTGQTLLNYKIKIIAGKGAGQERTITSVSAPTIVDKGNATSGAATSITDTNAGIMKRNWAQNQWRDYQVRITHGTGPTQIRKILSNTSTVLTISDYNWSAIDPWFYCSFSTTPAAGSLYEIESSIITVDSPWTTQPDSTSRFVVKSGGIWALSSLAASPYYSWQYYDIAADIWYTKSAYLTLFNVLAAALPTDAAISCIHDLDTNIDSGTLSGNGANGSDASYTMVDSGKTWTTGAYSNYKVNITETATGLVQERNILVNDITRIWTTRKWDTVPQASTYTYTITPDTDKIYCIGGGVSSMYQYSIGGDMFIPSKAFEYGVANGFAAQQMNGSLNAGPPIGLASATRITGGVLTVAVSNGGTGYRIDDLITIAGGVGSGATARVLTITPSTGAVLTLQLENTGTVTYSAGTVATTGGSGASNLTVTITVGAVATAVTTVATHNFKLGDVVTVTGDTSAGNYYNVSSGTILGITSTGFQYAVNSSVASSATFNAQSTTVLYDYGKSWTVNEHAGKYLLVAAIQSAGQGVVTQCRKIVSNTASSITVATYTAAVTGTSKYAIIDSRAFGTEDSFKGDSTRNGLISVCTGIDGGVTAKTSLADSTKSWISNYWIGGAARKIRVLCGPNFGNEIPIVSNSNNDLYFGAQSLEMTTANVYCIMDNYGVASGSGSTTSIVDNTQNWITGEHIGRRVKVTATNTDTANHGIEVAITASATTTLTTGTITSSVAGTSYSILNLPVRAAGNILIWAPNLTTGDGATPDTTSTGRYFISFKGGATNEIDKYNIATEIWEVQSTSPQLVTYTTGVMYAYDYLDRIYIASENSTALMTGRIFYYDIPKNRIEQAGQAPNGFGTGVLSNRMECVQTVDGLKYLYLMRNTDSTFWRVLCYW